MKKGIIAALIVAMMTTLTACQLNESQIKVIAQNTGLASIVTWIAYDNPEEDVKALVSDSMDIISTNLVQLASGQTYTELLYGDIENFARSENVPNHYTPVVLAGGLAVLNGIDLLFAMNPSWLERQDLSIGVVQSFIRGAKSGLALAKDDPVLIQAREFSTRRARGFQIEE